MLTRRQFVTGVAATTVGLSLPVRWALGAPGGAPPAAGAGLAMFVDALPIPATIDLRSGGSHHYAMAPGQHSFHRDLDATTTWGYGGAAYLGPTFEAQRGVPVDLTWSNGLGAHPFASSIDPAVHGVSATDATHPRAAVHLHGGNVAAVDDGGPTETFLPGTARTYHYANDQEAATLWYHDHALGITRLNVYSGLAGLYLLRDERESALELPGSGAHELPLVVQDRTFAADGSLVYGPEEWIPEFFGDVAVVNGKAWPFLDVDRGWYRFHVVNGSNARVYDFRLSTGDPFIQVGTDGGLLPAPIRVDRLVLAPGERADVLVDFSSHRSGDTVEVTNNAAAPYPDAKRSEHHGGVPVRSILQFRVGAGIGDRRALPTTLRAPIAPLPTSGPTWRGVRRMSLVEVMENDEPLVSLLNNQRFHEGNTAEVEVDTVERWDLVNTTGDAHPIHLHLVQFQILQRQAFDAAAYTAAAYPDPVTPGAGPSPVPDPTPYLRGRARPPAPNEAGWKDTVRVDPGQVVSVLVPFGAGAAPDLAIGRSYTGDYVWHCHILEHEDNEMMLPYRVVGSLRR